MEHLVKNTGADMLNTNMENRSVSRTESVPTNHFLSTVPVSGCKTPSTSSDALSFSP